MWKLLNSAYDSYELSRGNNNTRLRIFEADIQNLQRICRNGIKIKQRKTTITNITNETILYVISMVNVLTFLNIKIIDVDEKLRARNFLIANLISYTRLKIDSVEVIYKKLVMRAFSYKIYSVNVVL